MHEGTFQKRSFLEKEAAPQLRSAKGGAFVKSIKDIVVKPENVKFMDEAAQAKRVDDKYRKAGTGSLTAGSLLWLGKKVKGLKDPIEKGVAATARKMDNIDQAIGAKAAGKNPSTFRGKTFSKVVNNPVGTVTNANGSTSELLKADRQASIVAPIEKTVKFTAPFLATAYVADKLYPDEDDLGENVNQATYGNSIGKTSSLFEGSIFNRLDKTASLKKIASLEEQLEKYASDLDQAIMEKNAAYEQLEQVTLEKQSSDRRAKTAEQNYLRKQAEHEELRLRTIAQKRSKVAVDLSEEMLEHKLIKQAEYQETVDKLMECDDRTLAMYGRLVKEARTGSDCLESLSFFGEYKGNEKLAGDSKDYAKSGYSLKGQTIGEAARDLIK